MREKLEGSNKNKKIFTATDKTFKSNAKKAKGKVIRRKQKIV